MSNYYILLDNGETKPVSSMEWAEWFETAERCIAFDKLQDCEVSTVFRGLDHRFAAGPPLIFETMVFGGPLDQEMDRYSTKVEALAGHEAMVKRAKKETECEEIQRKTFGLM